MFFGASRSEASSLSHRVLHRPLGARSDGREPADDAELHSKLCKKVAQLTKVIYHLNTRNEDSEGRLQLLQDDYEAEIENLLQDASAKVAAASEEGGGKAAAAAIAEKVAALEMWNVFRHGPGPLCRVFAWTFFHPTRAPN